MSRAPSSSRPCSLPCGTVILLRPDFPGIPRETDLIAPGAVQITEQAPVVVDHAIQNRELCHFTARRRPSRPHRTGRGSCPSPARGPSSTCPRAHCRLPSATAAQTLHEGAGESHQQEEKRCITAPPPPSASPAAIQCTVANGLCRNIGDFLQDSPSAGGSGGRAGHPKGKKKHNMLLHMLIGTRRHHCWG